MPAAALRDLTVLWLVASAVADRRGRRITFGGLAIIAAVWTLDALLQALSGMSPLFWGLDALKQLIENRPMCSPEEVALLDRSEEHTSELQSLMRTSYAVFCLKKKTTTKTTD